MIRYKAGRWSVAFIFKVQGSVFPRALAWAVPSAVAAVLIRLTGDHDNHFNTVVSQAWFAIASVLGFLIVFRTQQGYSRYWEGASLMQSVKACWLNATSNLIAFCSRDPDREIDVYKFQQELVRLVSLMYCSALQGVADLEDNNFEVLDLTGLSPLFLQHVNLQQDDNKCFVVLQSIQQLMVTEIRSGVIDIAPPIVSRVFQEFSNGIVAYTNARKISDIPFPFPYAQLVTVLLIIFSCVTPCVLGFLVDAFWAFSLTFTGTFGFWSINYIAAEIEMPFGDDPNDLPVSELQCQMNKCLKLLLHPLSSIPPSFEFDRRHMKQAPPSMSGIVEQRSLRDDGDGESQRCMPNLCRRLSGKAPGAASSPRRPSTGIEIRNLATNMSSSRATNTSASQACGLQPSCDNDSIAQNASEQQAPCPDAGDPVASLDNLGPQDSSPGRTHTNISFDDPQIVTFEADGEIQHRSSGVVRERDSESSRSKGSRPARENSVLCQHPSQQASQVETLLAEIVRLVEQISNDGTRLHRHVVMSKSSSEGSAFCL